MSAEVTEEARRRAVLRPLLSYRTLESAAAAAAAAVAPAACGSTTTDYLTIDGDLLRKAPAAAASAASACDNASTPSLVRDTFAPYRPGSSVSTLGTLESDSYTPGTPHTGGSDASCFSSASSAACAQSSASSSAALRQPQAAARRPRPLRVFYLPSTVLSRVLSYVLGTGARYQAGPCLAVSQQWLRLGGGLSRPRLASSSASSVTPAAAVRPHSGCGVGGSKKRRSLLAHVHALQRQADAAEGWCAGCGGGDAERRGMATRGAVVTALATFPIGTSARFSLLATGSQQGCITFAHAVPLGDGGGGGGGGGSGGELSLTPQCAESVSFGAVVDLVLQDAAAGGGRGRLLYAVSSTSRVCAVAVPRQLAFDVRKLRSTPVATLLRKFRVVACAGGLHRGALSALAPHPSTSGVFATAGLVDRAVRVHRIDGVGGDGRVTTLFSIGGGGGGGSGCGVHTMGVSALAGVSASLFASGGRDGVLNFYMWDGEVGERQEEGEEAGAAKATSSSVGAVASFPQDHAGPVVSVAAARVKALGEGARAVLSLCEGGVLCVRRVAGARVAQAALLRCSVPMLRHGPSDAGMALAVVGCDGGGGGNTEGGRKGGAAERILVAVGGADGAVVAAVLHCGAGDGDRDGETPRAAWRRVSNGHPAAVAAVAVTQGGLCLSASVDGTLAVTPLLRCSSAAAATARTKCPALAPCWSVSPDPSTAEEARLTAAAVVAGSADGQLQVYDATLAGGVRRRCVLLRVPPA